MLVTDTEGSARMLYHSRFVIFAAGGVATVVHAVPCISNPQHTIQVFPCVICRCVRTHAEYGVSLLARAWYRIYPCPSAASTRSYLCIFSFLLCGNHLMYRVRLYRDGWLGFSARFLCHSRYDILAAGGIRTVVHAGPCTSNPQHTIQVYFPLLCRCVRTHAEYGVCLLARSCQYQYPHGEHFALSFALSVASTRSDLCSFVFCCVATICCRG